MPLTDDDGILAQLRDLTPVIRSNGARAVLEETGSGLLWTVPDGLAVPLGEWSPQDQQLTTQSSSTLEDVAEQMPPTAVADSFGVRAGTDVVLPVLLNDHDPNRKDVLSVVPGTLTALDPSFGTVSLVADDQLAVVHVGDTSGSTTFSYAVTDGYDESTTVSVTLTVVPDGENSAPLWCGVDGCVQPWPSPTLAPGGTATVQLLQGWVDPDGDVLVVDGVELAQTDVPLRVLAGSDGSMTVQHTDANGAAMVVPLSVTVSDVNGASTTRSMQLVVTSAPPLELTPRVLVGAVGDTSTVGVLDLVVSGSGAYRLVDASVAGATGTLDVVPNAAAGTVQLTPSGPGDYPVTVTVADVATGEEKSVVVRLRIPEDGAALTVAPTTVYVRQHEDTTVDVLAAVQSTSDGVLTVSSATTAYPAIGVDVIEARAVRVRAIDLGASPGPLGRVTVTVTDGLGGSADGVVTVVLAETGADEAVIAMPDTATVRAGAVVSIPVTANDVAPRGARLALEPDVVGSGTPGELVYTSGDTVRYLAPQVPGTYRLTYSVVRSGRPSILSSNVVTVTVVAPGQNRPPTPATLVARVSAGTSVTIPFSGTGLDPDGDAVQLVGLVQPEPGLGAASITSDGTGIVFVPGPTLSGGEQVQLGYRVRDAQGATATGAVRVAVQPAVAASAPPVAYTDYLRVRQGEQVPLRFEPLLNDHDPAGGTLELVGLRPEAPGAAGNEEFDRLNHLVVDSGLPGGGAAGQVQLTAGDVLGSHAYVYTVLSSASGSTAEGLIVVEVTPAAVVDKPEVADTVVTAARRSELSTTGIDVVSGRVVWPSGDASGLTLAVWGDSRTWHAEGARIVGPAPPQGAVVPFVLTGVDAGGRSVRSYGLLVIPALDDMRLTLAPGTTPLQVAEGETVVGAVRPLLALGPADTVELRASDRLPVQRSAARCSTSGDELTYVAGNGGPWSDSCTVQVRLPGQESWSDVVVPVGVEPQNPQPVLTSMSRTVAPGAVETIDLTQMLSWEGGRVGDVSTLDLTASLAPGTFDLQQDGSSATVTAAADAVPGSRMTVDVRLAPYDLRASIELVVGVAAQDAPRGATLVSACDVSSGRSCTVRVVGVAGEYDPFAGLRGAGLTLGQVGTGGTVTCSVATVTSAGTQDVTVTWPAVPKTAGGTCTVPCTVVDPHGRTGAGELVVDLQGYPAAPASVTAAAYTASGVTLDVALGDGA
ncbi:MAG: hypothetical protein HGA44_12340, partial [Cellulomonadaceae bacterium]|nr:hypothetical protein [Cellulomonadaceae bacterium]